MAKVIAYVAWNINAATSIGVYLGKFTAWTNTRPLCWDAVTKTGTSGVMAVLLLRCRCSTGTRSSAAGGSVADSVRSVRCRFMGEWEEAAEYAGRLLKDSRWSRTIYSYQRAAMLLMLPAPLPEARRREVDQLMGTLPDFKQRIAGKSLPAEKFVIGKSKTYQEQGGRLLLPGYELLYLWNGFKIVRKRRTLVEEIYSRVEAEQRRISSQPGKAQGCGLQRQR